MQFPALFRSHFRKRFPPNFMNYDMDTEDVRVLIHILIVYLGFNIIFIIIWGRGRSRNKSLYMLIKGKSDF